MLRQYRSLLQVLPTVYKAPDILCFMAEFMVQAPCNFPDTAVPVTKKFENFVRFYFLHLYYIQEGTKIPTIKYHYKGVLRMKLKKMMSIILAVLMLFSLLTPVAVSGATEYTGLKAELYELVNENVLEPGSNYTGESVSAYMEAVDRGRGVLEDDNATDEQVQTAITDIRNAIANLQYVNLDTYAISQLMSKGEEVFKKLFLVNCFAVGSVLYCK